MSTTDEFIHDLINAIEQEDFATAESIFSDLMGEKITDTLDAERVAVAAQIYGTSEVSDEETDAENDEETDE